MQRGYIKIWRKVKDSFVWKNAYLYKLFCHLLMEANWKETEFIFNNKKHILKRGQLIVGCKKLGDETHISKSMAYRFLNILENETLIEQQKTNLYTIVTIVNYDDYQANEQQPETPVKLQRNSSETPVNTSKELKNYNNNKGFDFLTNPGFQNTWRDFLEMRKKIRKPATIRAQEMILKDLHKESIETAIAMLEKSIRSCWQDVFPLKTNQTNAIRDGF